MSATDAVTDAAAGDPPARPRHTGPKPPPKSARRRSRELAVQGLYEWLLGRGEPGFIDAHIQEMDGFGKCDRAHFDALLHGSIAQAGALDAVLARHVDRKTTLLSPVEHAVLMVGVYEMLHCADVPYRVAINEGVEIAKVFGGTDGHKYVNGVLDKASAELRPNEARPVRARRALPAEGVNTAPVDERATAPDVGGDGSPDTGVDANADAQPPRAPGL